MQTPSLFLPAKLSALPSVLSPQISSRFSFYPCWGSLSSLDREQRTQFLCAPAAFGFQDAHLHFKPIRKLFFLIYFFFPWLCFPYSCPSKIARPLQAFKDKPLLPSLLKERWEDQP